MELLAHYINVELRQHYKFPETYITEYDNDSKILFLRSVVANPALPTLIQAESEEFLDRIFVLLQNVNNEVQRQHLILQVVGGTIQIEDLSIELSLEAYSKTSFDRRLVYYNTLLYNIVRSFVGRSNRNAKVFSEYNNGILTLRIGVEDIIIQNFTRDELEKVIGKYINGRFNLFTTKILTYKFVDTTFHIEITLEPLTENQMLVDDDVDDRVVDDRVVDIQLFVDNIKMEIASCSGDNVKRINVKFVKNPMKLYNNGFIIDIDEYPSNEKITYGEAQVYKNNYLNMLQEDYINGITADELLYWYGTKNGFREFFTKNKWLYGNMNYYRNEGLKTGYSLGLILNYPDQIYQDTLHPKTDMSLFRQPISDLTDSLKYIPVIRYSKDIFSGLYHEQPKCDIFCGTFYYVESMSTSLLGYRTSLTFKNKIAAYNYFYNKDVTDFTTDYYDDFMYTPLEAYDHGYGEYTSLTRESVAKLPQKKRYLGVWYEFYGNEDRYDQPLCKKANSLDIDILIFTNMIGGRQIVSEILDTRQRLVSFRHLRITS